MTDQARSSTDAVLRRVAFFRIACLVVALAYAAPVAYVAYDRLIEVRRQARERLIIQYRLWELHPEYQGSPQNWTRFASRLLTETQLMRRVRIRHGELAREIELDYLRDLNVAQAEVVLVAAAAWALPVGALYGFGLMALRRRRPPPEPPKPSTPPVRPPSSDSRYRP